MPLTKEGYRKRILDERISEDLHAFGAVCIEGPKWCGKTWTALHHAASACFIADPQGDYQNRAMARISPSLVLQGASPRLLDEWQEVPSLWDAVRHEVDQSAARGRFILTGSSTPNRKGVLHSGTGRIATIRMRPMSLFESDDSSGEVSLRSLFSGPVAPVRTGDADLDRLIRLTVRGGWPGSLDKDSAAAARSCRSYLKSTVENEAARVDDVRRDPRKLWMLIRSLARNEGTVVANRTLRQDMLEEGEEAPDVDTIAEYLQVLNRMFLLEDQPAFSPNLRSSIRVGKSPKRRFVDPSLAVAAMAATPERLLNDLKTFGFLFESLCVRDLRIHAESIDANLFHYRDSAGREIDAVIELPDGRWGAFEVKLGANQIDQAAKDLLEIMELMHTDPKAKAPEFLCVICGMTNAAYTRPDGVRVIPITALGP